MSYKGYPLNLKSDALNAFKTDFDSMLTHTIYTMEQKEGEEAQISITLKISLAKDTAPDPQVTAYAASRGIIIPKIEHKIKSLIRIQDERSGYVGGEKYELVWDPDAVAYVLREIKDSNPTLFDFIDDEKPNEKAPGDLLPGDEDEDPFGDVQPECDEYANGCPTVDSCGICCRYCPDPKDCLQICDREKERAGGLRADAVPEVINLHLLPAKDGDAE